MAAHLHFHVHVVVVVAGLALERLYALLYLLYIIQMTF